MGDIGLPAYARFGGQGTRDLYPENSGSIPSTRDRLRAF
jgi:hypothetical protein